MRTTEYLQFVGRLKGLSGTDLKQRVDTACERCAITDVRDKLLGKLSKGYRQRVGLAQAILHNPDVLILSTHILPEVEQTCEQVIIISKGKLVATDSVSNLRARGRGAELVLVEVGSRDGGLDTVAVQEQLEKVVGVSRVAFKEKRANGSAFEVENRKGALARGDLARAVVQAGWDLNELRPAAVS